MDAPKKGFRAVPLPDNRQNRLTMGSGEHNMLKRKCVRFLNRTDTIAENGVGILEWVLFGVVAVLCYLFFCHEDILITASHSMVYLDGHITDFYSACKEADGIYAANYLPTTFLIFAVWNLPIKLIGITPQYFGDWSVAFAMWNKLLPTLVYLVSAYLIYRLVKDRFGFSRQKATLTAFLFMTAPMAFFSQFIFCQYDIFVVFFMLVGMYYYFKPTMNRKDWAFFILAFGVATTIKYFAAVIFIVLLFLKTKNLLKIMLAGGIALLPLVFEFGIYFLVDRNAFKESVLGFSALDYAKGLFNLGSISINLLYVVLILLAAFAYFVKPKDREEFVKYCFFFTSGVCFALFGLMQWHPQWLLFMAPFWVIGTMICKHNRILLWVDALLGVVLIAYTVIAFVDGVDASLFRFGILHEKLMYNLNATLKMKQFFVFNGTGTLFSVIFAIFLLGFIIKHPKFDLDHIAENITAGRWAINVRFLGFTTAFIVAAFLCLPSFLNQPQLLWSQFGYQGTKIVTVSKKNPIELYTSIQAKSVSTAYIVCDKYRDPDEDVEDDEVRLLVLDVIDTVTGQTVAHGEAPERDIIDGNMNDPTRVDLDEPFTPLPDREYCFRLSTDSKREIAVYYGEQSKEFASFYKTYQKDYPDLRVVYEGERLDKHSLLMRLTGEIPD